MKNEIFKKIIQIQRIVLYSIFFNSMAQNVSTIAGGFQGNADGLGTSAQFNNTYGLAIDNEGSIFVADYNNHQIRKINTSGLVTTIAGSGIPGNVDGIGTNAQFNQPCGLAIDSSNNLYVSDSTNHSIRKISSTGVVTTIAGSTYGYADGTGSIAKFYYPKGIAIDNQRNIYVSDLGNNCIRKVSQEGEVTTVAGSTVYGYMDGIGSLARFFIPYGVAVDNNGAIFVADLGNQCIRKITPSGIVKTLAGSTQYGYADGIGSSAQFTNPCGITVDYFGNIYVADTDNHKIRKITSTGNVSTLAGTGQGYLDGTTSTAQFNSPYSIIFDLNGNLIVSDTFNNRVRKISNVLTNNNLLNQINVYPNPFSTAINFELNSLILKTITIFDLNGRSILSNPVLNNNTIYLDNLIDGFYIIQIETNKGSFYKKIIKK